MTSSLLPKKRLTPETVAAGFTRDELNVGWAIHSTPLRGLGCALTPASCGLRCCVVNQRSAGIRAGCACQRTTNLRVVRTYRRGPRIAREAARTPPTVWWTTQKGRRHDAAGFARSLRAGGPHMNSKGPPDG